jgi:hypothetical protein
VGRSQLVSFSMDVNEPAKQRHIETAHGVRAIKEGI